MCTPWALRPPFQYERWYLCNLSLARLFDSLVRVSRREEAPHFQRQVLSITEKSQLAATGVFYAQAAGFRHFTSARLTEAPVLHLVAGNVPTGRYRRMLRWPALTDEMEVRPLPLSRLQVLCHSLSKVLFKLSLTLLVRYRSSYFVFNFGRHIPAASHCTPKQCYSLSMSMRHEFLAQRANTGLGRNTHMRGCVQQQVCFAH